MCALLCNEVCLLKATRVLHACDLEGVKFAVVRCVYKWCTLRCSIDGLSVTCVLCNLRFGC